MGMALTHPERVEKLVLIDGLPDHVREKVASPSLQRALGPWPPLWVVEMANWFAGRSTTRSVLRGNDLRRSFDHSGSHRPLESKPSSTRRDESDSRDRQTFALMGRGVCHTVWRDRTAHPRHLGRQRTPYFHRQWVWTFIIRSRPLSLSSYPRPAI